MLIKIEAIVREEKYEEVKEALKKIQVNGITNVLSRFQRIRSNLARIQGDRPRV